MATIDAVRCALLLCSPLSYSVCQIFEDSDCSLPVDAGIGDTDALLETAWTLCRDLLCAFINMRFNHDANNAVLTVAELVGDGLGDLGLVLVVLE